MVDAALHFFAGVHDRDGQVGQLTRALLRAEGWTVDYFVVTPDDPSLTARLVPVHLLEASSPESLSLGCSRDEFLALADAIEYATATPTPTAIGVAISLTLQEGRIPDPVSSVTAGYALTPEGTVGTSHGSPVQASDGHLGHVVGLRFDRLDRRVTSVIVDAGHLWAKRRLAVPIAEVASVGDEVLLNIDVDQAAAFEMS